MRMLFTIAALFFAMALLGQGTTETKEYYLNKSKNQKTTGYILAGGGAALIVAGIVVGNGDDNNNDPNEWDFGPDFNTGLWLMGGGIVSGLASIPFFIGSANNARKAASIGVSQQKIIIPAGNGHVTVSQPAITLKISL